MPDEYLDLDVTDVAHGGVFVARHEGRVVFVADAIDGERVRVQLTDTAKSSFWRADVVEVLDASPHRRAHVWPAADVATAPADRPGGAEFGHIDLAHQRALKQRVLDDALIRFAGIPEPDTTLSPAGGVGDHGAGEHPDGLRWRTRVSLHVDDEGRIGPFAARSHRVIQNPDLPLATAEIEAVAATLGGTPGGFAPGRVDLVQPSDGSVRVIVRPAAERRPTAERAGAERPAERRAGAEPGAKARRQPRGRTRTARPPRPAEDPTARETVVERVGDREFRVDAGGFWQVHRLAASTLTSAVRTALESTGIDPSAHHLDLYGGVGLFAAAIAEAAGPAARVTSVESDARATEHAGENLAEWVGARAETERTDRYLARLLAQSGAADRARLARGVVLVDPPRAGAGREVVERIAALSPASVVYVACDPVALARDLGTFRGLGYEPARIDAFDLFPHSHHVEAVAVLARAAG
ncbi:MAG: 23S rRNA methyltransferase [Microbacterium sp. SCN 70-200]|uniref:class I SAM-dependent RNA methyltransferase n=1 Tax=unclassified Microbacterium TaxID=2609290 RepID=UPI00086955A4|nr:MULTISPECIES: TRAM domain-containing protein [unclassified Microbacterium]MBN9213823.1 class I SAM-dependent RNA methyltransferase [Microbacterium sp.]ODT42379.1 MAG: 23S rRNA methyltransferase [Microbacterium sp. SCN 70-200]OJV85493.1 MAG: 23S rRNA methyltransferase [Microbacterium sp. 70-16]